MQCPFAPGDCSSRCLRWVVAPSVLREQHASRFGVRARSGSSSGLYPIDVDCPGDWGSCFTYRARHSPRVRRDKTQAVPELGNTRAAIRLARAKGSIKWGWIQPSESIRVPCRTRIQSGVACHRTPRGSRCVLTGTSTRLGGKQVAPHTCGHLRKELLQHLGQTDRTRVVLSYRVDYNSTHQSTRGV